MKKTAVLGLILFMSIFAHNTTAQQKKQTIPTATFQDKNEHLRRNNPYLIPKLDDQMPQNPITKNKQQPKKHFSRNRKGKLST